MIAAIYARKSTDQTGVHEDQKSVVRQVQQARSFAAGRGWTVDEGHIYVDDGVSGAEFANRPGFVRLMTALKPRPPFQVVLMSEESRLGREAIETAYALKQLIVAGVRVFFYLENRERTFESPTDKLLMSVTAFADELEREKARQRTYDAMARKARAGHVTGGRVFGYDNVDVSVGGQRSHVARRVNDREAAIVAQIFALAARGLGQKRIAFTLNAEGAPAPRPQLGRPPAWCPSSVREVLVRELYRGTIVWNRSKKRDDWGQKHQQPRAEADWLRTDAPELRIVPDDLWAAAHDAFARRRAIHGRGHSLTGRPKHGATSPYLLSGFVECGRCHGRMTVRTSDHGRRRVARLACWHYTSRGTTVCANKAEAPLDALTTLVLDAIEEDLFAPGVLALAVETAIGRLEQPTTGPGAADAEAELRALDRETQRLTALVSADVGDLPTIIERLRAIKARRAILAAAAAQAGRGRRAQVSASSLRDQVLEEAAQWLVALREDPDRGRALLGELIDGRIVLTPRANFDRKRPVFTVRIPLTLRGLLEKVICPTSMASPAGLVTGRTISRRIWRAPRAWARAA